MQNIHNKYLRGKHQNNNKYLGDNNDYDRIAVIVIVIIITSADKALTERTWQDTQVSMLGPCADSVKYSGTSDELR